MYHHGSFERRVIENYELQERNRKLDLIFNVDFEK